MKKVLVNIRCANEFAFSCPESFFVEVCDGMSKRIKELSSLVTAAKADSIKEFNFGGTWSTLYLDGDEVTEQNWESYLSEINEQSSRVEIPQLNVTDTAFYWTAVPKHAGDDLMLRTNSIPLSFLDSEENVFIDLT